MSGVMCWQAANRTAQTLGYAYPISLQCQVLWVQDIAKHSGDTYGSRRMKKALTVLGYPVTRNEARIKLQSRDSPPCFSRSSFLFETQKNRALAKLDVCAATLAFRLSV